jgi:hypothetical protein
LTMFYWRALAGLADASTALAQSTAPAFVVKIPGAGMTSSVSLALSNGSGGPGGTVEMPVNLTSSGTAAPAEFQLDLSFDAQKLTFASARAGPELVAANKTISSSMLSNGSVRLLSSGMNQTAVPNGVVAYVSFTLNPSLVIGSALVTPSNCLSASGLGGALSTGCTAGTVNAFACDLNGDGTVTVTDLQLIVNEALGTIPAVHDLNHDGVLNVADIQKEINAVFGLGCPY